MENKPKVSVIIPSYNHGKFLEKRILSVLNQTYSNFDVYILDDFSIDESKTIIEDFKDHAKVEGVVYNKSNSGSVFNQWVEGINRADGKYLWIAESDDYSDLSFLEKLVSIAENHPEAGLVFCDSYTVDEYDTLFEKVSKRHQLTNDINFPTYAFSEFKNAANYFFTDMLILNASSVLFDLEKFKACVDLDELCKYKNVGDVFCYVSILKDHEIIFRNETLNYRRDHGMNTTKLNFSSGILYGERFEILLYFYSVLKDYGNSKNAFRKFLKINLVPAVDARYFRLVFLLMNKFLFSNVISFIEYIRFTTYTLISFLLKRTPYFLRKEMKIYLKRISL